MTRFEIGDDDLYNRVWVFCMVEKVAPINELDIFKTQLVLSSFGDNLFLTTVSKRLLGKNKKIINTQK